MNWTWCILPSNKSHTYSHHRINLCIDKSTHVTQSTRAQHTFQTNILSTNTSTLTTSADRGQGTHGENTPLHYKVQAASRPISRRYLQISTCWVSTAVSTDKLHGNQPRGNSTAKLQRSSTPKHQRITNLQHSISPLEPTSMLSSAHSPTH